MQSGERVLMRALVGQIFDGRRLYIGDTFSAPLEQVAELEAIHLATRAQNSHPVDLDAMSSSASSSGKRSRYRRRDMQPRDE